MGQNISWRRKAFEDLTLIELYDAMKLRQEVFVVEQDCVYLDADGLDQDSFHVFGYDKDVLVAYSRVVPRGLSYLNEPSIGRIITALAVRKFGYGIDLMHKSISYTEELFGKTPIRISAQSHLEKFYGKFGFESTGKNYLEDGIPHSEMLRA